MNCRENLSKMKTMTDSTLEKFQMSTVTNGRTLQGVHTYDILANPLYLESFQYVSAATENRCDYIIDGNEDEEGDAA